MSKYGNNPEDDPNFGEAMMWAAAMRKDPHNVSLGRPAEGWTAFAEEYHKKPTAERTLDLVASGTNGSLLSTTEKQKLAAGILKNAPSTGSADKAVTNIVKDHLNNLDPTTHEVKTMGDVASTHTEADDA